MTWCGSFLLVIVALALIGGGFAWIWRIDGK